MKKVGLYIIGHKAQTLVILLIISGSGYYGYTKYMAEDAAPQYITAAVEKGTLVVSVSGTGQVSGSNQVDVKPKASGNVVVVAVEEGQDIEANAVLVKLDAGDAEKAVRDAEVNLSSARLALAKLTQPADAFSVLQAENSLDSAKDNLKKLKLSQATDYQKTEEAKQKAIDNIAKAYEDAFNEISNTFLDLPAVVTKLDEVLHGQDIGKADKAVEAGFVNTSTLINTSSQDDREKLQSLIDGAESDYKSARSAFDKNLISYKAASRFSERSVVEALLFETLEVTKLVAEAIKSQTTLLDAWVDFRTTRQATGYLQVTSKVAEYRANLNTYNGQVNGHLSSLLSVQRTLQDDKDSLTSAERDLRTMDQNNPLDLAAAEQSVKEKQASLDKLKAGPDLLDIQSQELSVKQRQNVLEDARQKLADYTVRAPLNGIIAKLNVKVGDPASSGTAVATIVTKQQIAAITLNEVDVAKIKIGQKVTLTFDAIDGLSMTGKVIAIDIIGATSQGVVSYGVKIGLDGQNERIKPGMSVSASIVTDVRQDVVLVPNSAVKSNGRGFYVETLRNGQPEQRAIIVGLANDSLTEVSGGIQSGENVITQTITSTSTNATTTTGSSGGFGGFRIPGLGGMGH